MTKRPKPLESFEEARRVIEEAERRAKSLRQLDYHKLCFPGQLEFVLDESRLVAGLCSRRAGKTDATGFKMIRTAEQHPHCTIPYITLSRPSAKRIMWPKLLKWDRELGLGAKFNHADLRMTLKNGASIELGGANDEAEIERYRGGAYPLCVIDEAQAFRPYIANLIEQILFPATLDYKGQIVVIGTPNPTCHGFFYDITTGNKGWSCHHWTIFDNPFIPEPEEQLQLFLNLSGYTRSDPKIRREFFGEWVRDTEGLVYDMGRPMTILDTLPEAEDWCYVLGVDIGYVDASAFVTLAYSTRLSKVVVVESHQRTELIPSAIAVEIERLTTQHDYEAIVIDPGGGGKLMVEELKQRYGIPAEVADKKAKLSAIENLNGDIRAGVFHVIRWSNDELIHDASLLQWNYTKIMAKDKHWGGNTPKELLQIDDRTPDHLLDAMLYAYRRCKQFLYDPEVEAAKPGTPEWFKAEEDALLAAAERRVSEGQGPWWEDST